MEANAATPNGPRSKFKCLHHLTSPFFSCVYNDRVITERSKRGHRDRLSGVGKNIDKCCKFQSKQKTIDHFIITS